MPVPVREEVLTTTTVADWIAKDGQQAIERSQNGTDDLDLRVHSDLRQVNWTVVVAPLFEPIECFSATLQKCNRNVLQIAALNLVAEEVENPANPQGKKKKALVLQQCRPLGAIGQFFPLNTVMEREEFRNTVINGKESPWPHWGHRFAQALNIGKANEKSNTFAVVSFNYES